MLDFILILCCKSCVSEYVNYIIYTLDLVRLDFHAKKNCFYNFSLWSKAFFTHQNTVTFNGSAQWTDRRIIRVVAVLVELSDVF